MKIGKNTIAKIIYELRDQLDNSLLQHIPTDEPAEFLIGHNLLLDAFEARLIGLNEGDNFFFTLSFDEAYGPVDTSAIFDLPISTFAEEDGRIDEEVVQVGHVFPMADNEGNRHFGKIIRKMKDRVTMDFNHPMAGKNLIFKGVVVETREASQDDISAHLQMGSP